ncbi:hypothetical protein AAEJ42_22010, partial [Shewanella algae]|uniref:hypothetical protein n=1 Tax=Shewanella algae TaxID=38313 RepID=UPI00313E6DF8
ECVNFAHGQSVGLGYSCGGSIGVGCVKGLVCHQASASGMVGGTGTCQFDIAGAWEFIGTTNTHYEYTFNADGTFVSSNQPGCAFTTPRCMIMIAP